MGFKIDKIDFKCYNGFVKMTKKILKNLKYFLVPHEGNKHRPLSLRPKSLRAYAYFLITVKVLVTLLLTSFYPSPAFLSLEIQDKIIQLINQARQEKTLASLEVSNILNLAAQAKAQDMIDQDYFSHTSPDGSKSWNWINRDKYHYTAFGENLAMDFTSAETAHSALMGSPTHAKNIINSKYEDVGIGVAYGEMNGRETIVLVQFFGRETSLLSASTVSVPAVKIVKEVKESVLETQELENQRTKEPKNIETEKQKEALVVEEQKEPAFAADLTPVATSVKGVEAATAGEEEIYIDKNLTTPEAVVVSVAETGEVKSFLNRIILYADWLLWGFMIFLIASLLINILVRVRIQHTNVIGQSLLVILVIATLLLFKTHFIEDVLGRVISLV